MNSELATQRDGKTAQEQVAKQYDWLVLIFYLVGWIGGMAIGRSIGSAYQGIGLATGEDLGEWIGWGFGVGTMLVLSDMVGRRPYFKIAQPPVQCRVVLSAIWIAFVFLGTSLAAAFAFGGKPLWWIVLFCLGLPYTAAVLYWVKDTPNEAKG